MLPPFMLSLHNVQAFQLSKNLGIENIFFFFFFRNDHLLTISFLSTQNRNLTQMALDTSAQQGCDGVRQYCNLTVKILILIFSFFSFSFCFFLFLFPLPKLNSYLVKEILSSLSHTTLQQSIQLCVLHLIVLVLESM